MNLATTICVSLVVGLTLLRAGLSIRYLRSTRDRGGRTEAHPDSTPRVAVFMPVRGLDPSLPEAIRNLLQQDYTNFTVTIIVDSRSDVSWDVVRDTLSFLNDSRVLVVPLTRRNPECSLVCNGLLQFLDSLPEDVELVTFCGSDMVVARNWMSEMVNALSDPSVGCTLGNRWYMSPHTNFGWMLRYLWNVVANTLAWQFRIPWGGTVCLRVRDIQRSGLKTVWGKSLIEDIPIRDAIEGLGLRMQYLPELLVINRETISFRRSLQFLARQMFWILTYSRNASSIAIIALLFSFSSAFVIGSSAYFLLSGQASLAVPGLAALALTVAVPQPLMLLMERRIRSRMRRRGEEITPLGVGYFIRMPFALLLTQMTLGVLVIIVSLQRNVRWRGVTYRVNGPYDARLTSDSSATTAEGIESENAPAQTVSSTSIRQR